MKSKPKPRELLPRSGIHLYHWGNPGSVSPPTIHIWLSFSFLLYFQEFYNSFNMIHLKSATFQRIVTISKTPLRSQNHHVCHPTPPLITAEHYRAGQHQSTFFKDTKMFDHQGWTEGLMSLIIIPRCQVIFTIAVPFLANDIIWNAISLPAQYFLSKSNRCPSKFHCKSICTSWKIEKSIAHSFRDLYSSYTEKFYSSSHCARNALKNKRIV